MPRPYQENPTAKRWLWIGVSVISAIILVLWGWATGISLSSFSWKKTPEKKLFEQSKEDWNYLFNNEADKIKKERTKTQIKSLLNTIIAEINTTTETTSTAEMVVTTSSAPTTNSKK